jgi:acetyltransferase-like isoleucine patch superfamily enzyme
MAGMSSGSGLIVPHKGFVPKVDPAAFIAVNATLVGDVEIAANASVWFGCILRGDGPGIRIGENSNLQDGTVVHVAARGLMTIVGKDVTVGHMVLLHACEVQDGAFIGMHSTVLDGAGQDRAQGRTVGGQSGTQAARSHRKGLRDVQAHRRGLRHAGSVLYVIFAGARRRR